MLQHPQQQQSSSARDASDLFFGAIFIQLGQLKTRNGC
jgi:hypothetical protein